MLTWRVITKPVTIIQRSRYVVMELKVIGLICEETSDFQRPRHI